MRDNDKLTPHTEVVAVEFNNFLEFVDRLSDDQKQVLAQKLIGQNSPLTVVLGNYNVINNSVVLQPSGDSEKIAEQLQKLSPDTIKSFTEAIAMWMRQNKNPQ
ncbi:MAG: hypothetical protein AAFR77_12200 [Cyanobacteria bacterium J06631_2]